MSKIERTEKKDHLRGLSLSQDFWRETQQLGWRGQLAFGDIDDFKIIANDLKAIVDANNPENEIDQIIQQYRLGQRSVSYQYKDLVIRIRTTHVEDYYSDDSTYRPVQGRYTKLVPDTGEAVFWLEEGYFDPDRSDPLSQFLELHHMHKSLMLDARGRRNGEANLGFTVLVSVTDVIFMDKLSQMRNLPDKWKDTIRLCADPGMSSRFSYAGKVIESGLPECENIVRQYWKRIYRPGVKGLLPRKPVDITLLKVK